MCCYFNIILPSHIQFRYENCSRDEGRRIYSQDSWSSISDRREFRHFMFNYLTPWAVFIVTELMSALSGKVMELTPLQKFRFNFLSCFWGVKSIVFKQSCAIEIEISSKLSKRYLLSIYTSLNLLQLASSNLFTYHRSFIQSRFCIWHSFSLITCMFCEIVSGYL